MIVHAFLAFEDKELSNLYSDYALIKGQEVAL